MQCTEVAAAFILSTEMWHQNSPSFASLSFQSVPVLMAISWCSASFGNYFVIVVVVVGMGVVVVAVAVACGLDMGI